jgi:hypothetical protein
VVPNNNSEQIESNVRLRNAGISSTGYDDDMDYEESEDEESEAINFGGTNWRGRIVWASDRR